MADTTAIDALGHDFSEEWTIDTEATCTQEGSKSHHCTRCDEMADIAIDALGHDFSEEWTIDTEATCTQEGSKSHHCTRCDEIADTTAIDALGHDFSEEWTIDTEATCTQEGSKSHHCTRCDEMADIAIDALGHDFSEEWTIDTEATCTQEGSKSHHCTRCDEIADTTAIDALGHDFSEEWTIDTEATCTQEGSKSHHCTRCDEIADIAIDALGHDFSEEWTIDTEATCTQEGSESHHCTRCDEIADVTAIPVAPHTYRTTVTKATTNKNGFIVESCTGCGKEHAAFIYYPETISLAKTSYTYNGRVQKPAVTVKGANGEIIPSSNYTVTYPSGCKAVGKYDVEITFKGNYSGSVTRTYTIVPKGTTIKSLTAGSKRFTVKWTKQATQTAGYQIQYSTSNKLTSPKTVTVTKNTKVSKTISKLLAKKKYYVRIRTYKTVSGTKYYSAWSAAKSVTTKK